MYWIMMLYPVTMMVTITRWNLTPPWPDLSIKRTRKSNMEVSSMIIPDLLSFMSWKDHHFASLADKYSRIRVLYADDSKLLELGHHINSSYARTCPRYSRNPSVEDRYAWNPDLLDLQHGLARLSNRPMDYHLITRQHVVVIEVLWSPWKSGCSRRWNNQIRG